MNRKEASARLHGRVRMAEGAHIAQGSIVRSVDESVQIGAHTWLLENSVLIGTPEQPAVIGSKTVFGHKCMIIGAEIGDLCEIGNGTIFMPGCKVENRCITGEGTLIPAGTVIPDDSVVVGRPGRVIRSLTEADKEMIQRMRGGNVSLPADPKWTIEEDKGDTMGKLHEYKGMYPTVAESAVLYDTAEVTGDVHIGENSVIAAGVRIIGNSHGPVRIGNNVQILENCVLHLLPDNELILEDNVTIGPGCIIHGTHIGENTVIEAGSTVCDYSAVGENCRITAGSLVKQRDRIPAGKIATGFPAKVTGENEDTTRPDWAIRQNV